MRLPLVRSFADYAAENGDSDLESAVNVLVQTSEMKGLKEPELEVVGELISNILGGIDVAKAVEAGTPKSQALNEFMARVLGSIDR